MVVAKSRLEPSPLDKTALEWLANRGISEEVANEYSLLSTLYRFNGERERRGAICFPYTNDGSIYSWKLRSLAGKFYSCSGSPSTLFGIENISIGNDLFIVEGEMDVLAMRMAGYKAVSMPHGALDKPLSEAGGFSSVQKLKSLGDANEYIEAAGRVFIALDNDGPGDITSEEIARRVGKEKCWRVKFGEHKDANDALLAEGVAFMQLCVKKAEPWPVSGLYDAMTYRDEVFNGYDNGVGAGKTTGYRTVDNLYTVADGQLTVVTGVPGSGKSEWCDQLMINLASSEGWTFAVCSFENEPRYHLPKLLSKHLSKPFFKGPSPRATREEVERGLEWVNDHFFFLHQKDGSLTEIDDIISRIKIAVLRYGVRGVIIDPYNFISKSTKDMSETDWVSEMLTKLKLLATQLEIHIWFVAHPTKMQRGQDGKIMVPGGYDISGSANWFNKTDNGITVHRTKESPTIAEIHVWKIRFAWLGKMGNTKLSYNTVTTRYEEIPEEIMEDWPNL